MASAPPQGLTVEGFLAVGIALTALTGVFVIIRLASDRWFTGSLHLDGFLSIAALIFIAACTGSIYRLLLAATDPNADFYYVIQLQTAQIFLTGFALWSSKAPIIILYIRLFSIHKWVRILCYFMLVVTALVIFISDAYNTAQCVPKSLTDPNFMAHYANCNHVSSIIGIICGFLAVFTDAIIFVLPLPILAKLNLPLVKKIGLCLVFLVGSVAVIVSAVSLSYKWRSLSGETPDLILASALTIIEYTVVLIVGCVPASYSFWTKYIVTTRLYSIISTMLSQISLPSRGSRGETSKRSVRGEPLTLQPGKVSDVENSNFDYVTLHGDDPAKVSANWRRGGQADAAIPLERV